MSTKDRIIRIAMGGLSIALSFVLSNIKIFELPQGGTITPAATLPLILFALAYGPAWGLAVAFAFSLTQLIGGYILNFPQLMLDYVIGYTAYGLAGLGAVKNLVANPLKNFAQTSIVKSIFLTILCFAVRCLSSVLSGVIFFSEYAGAQNPWIYSIVYNGSFLAVDMAIVIVIMLILHGIFKAAFGVNRKAGS